MSHKTYSLFSIIVFIVILSISFFVVSIMTYDYLRTKSLLQNDLNTKSQIIVSRAQYSISHFIEEYAIKEYENLIKSEMLDKSVYAILVDNKHMAAVLSDKSYISGKIRDKNWKIQVYQHQQHSVLLQNDELLVKKVNLFTPQGIELGTLSVYLTNKFINEELKNYFIYSFIVISIIAIIVVLMLYFSISKFVLTPLNKITSYILHCGLDNKQMYKLNVKGSKETSILASSINQMLTTIRDSNQELEKKRIFLNNVIETAPIRIFWKDINGVYLGANKLFLEDTGFTSIDEIIGKTDFELPWKDTEAKEYVEDDQKVINSKEPKLNFKETYMRDTELMHLITSKVPLLNEKGEVIGVLGVYDDITQKIQIENKVKQHEIQLIQQSRLAQMGEMIAMIAHQWRQPLNTISITSGSIAYKLQKDIMDKEYFDKKCQVISDQVNHLSHTIDDFRNFFKPDKEKQIISAQALIDETLNIIQPTLEQNKITVNVATSQCVHNIETYTNKVKQVILNLLQNAQDAFSENNIQNPVINISAQCTEISKCSITVEDNGGGIAEDIIEKIFDPYFSTKIDKNGTGLGLYMSKTIIEDHCQGRLEVESKEGYTKFKITL